MKRNSMTLLAKCCDVGEGHHHPDLFFRGEGNVGKEILSRSPSAIGMPGIVLYELEVGIAKSTSPRKRLWVNSNS